LSTLIGIQNGRNCPESECWLVLPRVVAFPNYVEERFYESFVDYVILSTVDVIII
jgi:hypothetical protein